MYVCMYVYIYIVPCHIISFRIVSYHIILHLLISYMISNYITYYIILYYVMLCYITLHCTITYENKLCIYIYLNKKSCYECYVILCYVILYCIILYCIILHYIALLHYISYIIFSYIFYFSRMRSKGSRFTLGVWGLRVCSLGVAFTVAAVRNRPCEDRMAVPMVSSAERWSFLEVSNVSLLRFAWQAWHFVTFRRVL